jgi:hypothetical protein
MPPTDLLLAAVVLTWLVEWVVVGAVLRRVVVSDGLGLLLINAATNPLANAAYNLGSMHPFAVEVVVILLEIPLFRFFITPRWSVAAPLAVAANIVSALASLFFC